MICHLYVKLIFVIDMGKNMPPLLAAQDKR